MSKKFGDIYFIISMIDYILYNVDMSWKRMASMLIPRVQLVWNKTQFRLQAMECLQLQW